MRLKVNPNRMELLRLRRRLILAEKGYKLLEDKLDELMRFFLASLKEIKELQKELDLKIKEAFLNLILARSLMRKEDFQKAIQPKEALKINFKTKRLLNLDLPEINLEDIPDIFHYDFFNTPSELDLGLLKFKAIMPKLIRLANLYKICQLVSTEIEKTRRRKNALEYILIPSIKETIDYITDRLSELERENLVRLMRIKELIRIH